MGNLIKEALQVNRYTPLSSFHDRLSNMLDRPVLTLASPKPKIGRCKPRIKDPLQHQVTTLTHDPIHHRGNPQLPLLLGTFLLDEYSSGRLESVDSGFAAFLGSLEEGFPPSP